jgi:hypothetical protein
MAWLTTATTANLIITTQTWTERRYFPFTGAAESRVNTTTTSRYVGIAIASAAGIATTLAGETGCTGVTTEEQGDGSAHVIQTIETEGTWA